jgi:hypothetical protein
MKQLKDYLGTWKYTHGTADKYYSIIPKDNLYLITWGNDIDTLANLKKRHTVVDNKEAFRRIRALARGGYTQIEKWTGVTHLSAELTVEDLYPKQQKHISKAVKPPKETFNFLDWVASRK